MAAQNMRDEMGMPAQLASLTTSRPAAELRVSASGADHRRHLRIARRVEAITAARRLSDAWEVQWHWNAWFTAGPTQRLHKPRQALETHGVTVSNAADSALGQAPRPVTLQQRRCAAEIPGLVLNVHVSTSKTDPNAWARRVARLRFLTTAMLLHGKSGSLARPRSVASLAPPLLGPPCNALRTCTVVQQHVNNCAGRFPTKFLGERATNAASPRIALVIRPTRDDLLDPILQCMFS